MRAYYATRPEQLERRAERQKAWWTPERRRKYYTPKGRSGVVPWNKGLTKSDKRVARYAETQSAAKKGHRPPWLVPPVRRGPENNKWKGGVTPESQRIRRGPEYRAWRLAVLERDNYTCRQCERRKERGMVSHHVLDALAFPDRRTDVANGITLCQSCHRKVHSGVTRWSTQEELEAHRRTPHSV